MTLKCMQATCGGTTLRARFDFLWGTANAALQIEGDCDTNSWHIWKQAPKADGTHIIRHGVVSGRAADHWNRRYFVDKGFELLLLPHAI